MRTEWHRDGDHVRKAYEKRLGDETVKILTKARRCEERLTAVVEWNCLVHSPLFSLVREDPEHAKIADHFNATSARITLLPANSKTGLESRKHVIDYIFCLQPNKEEQKIDNISQGENYGLLSINQTRYPPLRFSPILLSIVTKLPNAKRQKSDIQLAAWTAASLARTRLLLADNGHAEVMGPALPLLSIYGHDMYFSAVKENGCSRQCDIWEALSWKYERPGGDLSNDQSNRNLDQMGEQDISALVCWACACRALS